MRIGGQAGYDAARFGPGRRWGLRGMWPAVRGLTSCVQSGATSNTLAGAQR